MTVCLQAIMLLIRYLFTDNYTICYADDGAAVLKDESLDTSSHLYYQNKVGCLDMNLGDPDVLETIWMKALENCTSNSLHSLLQKDGKLSSLYTTQGKSLNCVFGHFSSVVFRRKIRLAFYLMKTCPSYGPYFLLIHHTSYLASGSMLHPKRHMFV